MILTPIILCKITQTPFINILLIFPLSIYVPQPQEKLGYSFILIMTLMSVTQKDWWVIVTPSVIRYPLTASIARWWPFFYPSDSLSDHLKAACICSNWWCALSKPQSRAADPLVKFCGTSTKLLENNHINVRAYVNIKLGGYDWLFCTVSTAGVLEIDLQLHEKM